MRINLLRPSALSIALLSGPALAVGFGELTLLSRVGEPLRAEVSIVSGGHESIETACFSLAPMRESDLPVVTSARFQLVRDGQNFRLLISGKPVADPVFMIALRAGCGVELQRDFVLMPQAPITTAEAMPIQMASPTGNEPPTPVQGRKWRASAGETLESLAETLAPDDMIRQRRMLVALRRANPELEPSSPLPEGTTVHIPDLRRRATSESRDRGEARPSAKPARARAELAAAPPLEARARPEPTRGKGKATAGDRLVLAAAPEDLRPGERPAPPRGSLPEMEERMLKMETTLHLLNEEITKLNQALALTTEALSAQQQLQAAQNATAIKVSEKTPAPVAPAPPGVPQPSGGNWMELLLSAGAGGLMVALSAHILALRRRNAVDEEIPLAVQVSRPHAQIEPQHQVEETAAQPLPAKAPPVESHVEDLGPEQDADKVEVTENDSDSLQRIAEIMLSFGRVHDAAETLALYIKDASPRQVQPWIMLLDLYRRGNMPREFATLAGRIRERFNIHVPTWDEAASPESGLKSLENYPHIVDYLQQAWGTQECLSFLQDLVTDNRSGRRVGFPLEVVEEIVLLMRLLEDGYGLKRA